MAEGTAIPVVAPKPELDLKPGPSVINLVGLGKKTTVGEGVYTSVSDPVRPGSEAATSPKDWTIPRPKAEKVEDPPPVPISKMLMDHVKSLWLASASAVQVQQQIKNEADTAQPNPALTPSARANEVLTYSPTKIAKAAKAEKS
jgi:hypothetical protein